MKFTDFGVALFWKNEKLKALLTSVGYRRIGTYLYFDNIAKNRWIVFFVHLEFFYFYNHAALEYVLHCVVCYITFEFILYSFFSFLNSFILNRNLVAHLIKLLTTLLSIAEDPDEKRAISSSGRRKVCHWTEFRGDSLFVYENKRELNPCLNIWGVAPSICK